MPKAMTYGAVLLVVLTGMVFSVLGQRSFSVEISTDRDEADPSMVVVDGRQVCSKTPCQVTMEEGEHQVSIQPSYHEIEMFKLTPVSDGKVVKRLRLKKYGGVKVTSQPEGLTVYKGDSPVGTTPFYYYDKEGRATFSVREDACNQAVAREVALVLGTTLSVDLAPSLRTKAFDIKAETREEKPVKADILIDGRKVGQTPGRVQIPLCARIIELTSPEGGYIEDLFVEEEKPDMTVVVSPDYRKDFEFDLTTIYKVGTGVSPASMNADDALITIVEFSDYECPFCGRAERILQRVLKDYPGQVRVFFRQFPLPFHHNAMPASKAAMAAHRQGKFWPMHRLLFEHQKALSYDDFFGYARQIGLNLDRFKEDMMDTALEDGIYADQQEGKRLGVRGTPTFFINGVKIGGAQPSILFHELLKILIPKARAAGLKGGALYEHLTKDGIVEAPPR